MKNVDFLFIVLESFREMVIDLREGWVSRELGSREVY